MRITLVFPPRTGPTYMPLGVACLAAVASSQKIAIDQFDANLELWNSLCDDNAFLGAMRTFARGSLDGFLDPGAYATNMSYMGEGIRRIDELEQQARQYLAGNGLGTELSALMARHGQRMLRAEPEIVGFSVMYLDQLPFVLAQAKYLHEELSAPCRVVLGGAAMSALDPVELLQAAPWIDGVIVGEGEVPFAALLAGQTLGQIPGCTYRDGAGVVSTGNPESLDDLSTLAMPDFSVLADGGYFNPVPVLSIYGCRGCKWRRCRFCSHNQSFGRHRQRPPLTVALEMLARQNSYGCRHFYFVDQYVDPIYLDALSDAILAMKLDCRFQIMARTIADYTPALLAKAARAGCCWISWGMESGSQRLLTLMNKGTEPEASFAVLKNASAVGISNLLMMIFGAPGSDDRALDDTFSFLDRSWPYVDGMTASAFVLFAETDYGRHPDKYGLEVIGTNAILDIGGRPIHDMKLRFRREGEDGRAESPLAAREIDLWERRRAWLPPLPFHGRLCCEHYLLYADALQAKPRPGKRDHCA